MVDVAPFRALEYNPDKVDPARVASPPYDVISANLLKELRAASPHNVVHVTLAPDKQGRKKVDPFVLADQTLDAWLAEGVMRTTPDAIVYAYECAYEHRGAPKRMRGVIMRLRLDATYTQVLPHEEIFPKPSEERTKILRATGTDLEPIQLLYAGRSAEGTLWAYVDGSQRAADVTIPWRDGTIHRYWRVNDAAVIATIADAFKGRRVYIADGHHRYAASVRYAEERRVREYRPPKDAPWEYKMCLFVHSAEPGLLILPTHRIVKKAKVKDSAKLVERWSEHFRVERVALDASNPITQLQRRIEASTEGPMVGAWLGNPKTGYVLAAKSPIVPETILPGRSQTYRGLDVVHLQRLALEAGMGVPEAKWGDDVTYTRDDVDAQAWVQSKKAVAVLLHRPTRLVQMRAIADAGEKMPQKSTYFLPKTLSGVAMYRIGKPVKAAAKPRITS